MGAGITEPGRKKILQQNLGEKGVLAVNQSFETDEVGALKIYFPFKVRINKIRSGVVKALAGTDAGTITGANSTGASTGGVTTHALSAAIGDTQAASPTTNNVVEADSYYQLTSAKTTKGGKVQVTLEYTKE